MMKTWQRHLISVTLLLILAAMFVLQAHEIAIVHVWNRGFADAAFILLCLTLIIGPAARLSAVFNGLLPLRRELGIWMAAAAVIHVAIYSLLALRGDVLRFFTDRGEAHTLMLRNVPATANWVGLIALLYAMVLAVTSNDASQKLLGRGWKLLQQQSYTLFVLTLIHAGLFVYFVYEVGYGLFRPVYWIGLILTAGFQAAGYARTVFLAAQQRRLDR